MSSPLPDLRIRFLSDITPNSYSPSELRACIRHEDFWKHDLQSDTIEGDSVECSTQFYNSNFTVNTLSATMLNGKRVFHLSSLRDELCVRRTNQILRKSLRMTILNRDDEIRQLISILETENKSRVHKTDITSFFESIDFAFIIGKLEAEGFRNHSALCYLRSLNRQLMDRFQYPGLPRGLSISSTLADYILHDFDKAIINQHRVVYFSRYVDDICIIHFEEVAKLQETIGKLLPAGLQFNKRKTSNFDYPSCNSLCFLGYAIALNKPISVSIAPSKIGKAKKRIILSLRHFLKERNFESLYNRLLFLSATVQMKKAGRHAKVCCGYRHVYRFCTPELVIKQMTELDGFFHGVLTSRRFSLAKQITAALTPAEMEKLRTISFKRTFENKITYFLGKERIAHVKKAWQYE